MVVTGHWMTSDQGLRHSQHIEHHTCTEQWNMNLIVSTEKKHSRADRYRFANHGKSSSGVGVWDVFFRNAETLGPSNKKTSVRSVAGPLLFF